MEVGIDLGTTNSTIGFLRADGGRAIFPPIPSLGAWRNGEVVFGAEARDLLRESKETVFPVRNLKLMLGIERDLRFGQTNVPVEDLTAELIRHLMAIANSGASGIIESAVISTPINVSAGHREALRKSAYAAGINNVRLVYEPTAALIGAQRFAPFSTSNLVLVVDWGGGTLDLAAVRTDGTFYEELAIGGDIESLGGSRMDLELTNTLLSGNSELKHKLSDRHGDIERLRDEVESLKLEILSSLDGPDGADEERWVEWLERSIALSPRLVFTLIEDYADRASQRISETLMKAGIKTSAISHILFAGGVAQAPEVQRRICRDFPDASVISSVSGSAAPLRHQELTGAGCTEITSRKMTVELGVDVGVRESDDTICVLLPKGLPIELDTFRKAEFLVTDPEAPEAVLELGLFRGVDSMAEKVGTRSHCFEPLHQEFLPRSGSARNRATLDELELHIGVDRNFSVSFYARLRLSSAVVNGNVTGIPMMLRFEK